MPTLRDDGVSYGDYLEQLTSLIFLKMADEYAKPPYNRECRHPYKTPYKIPGKSLGKSPGLSSNLWLLSPEN